MKFVELNPEAEIEVRRLFDDCKRLKAQIEASFAFIDDLSGLIQNPIEINRKDLLQHIDRLIKRIDDVPPAYRDMYKLRIKQVTAFIQKHMLEKQ